MSIWKAKTSSNPDRLFWSVWLIQKLSHSTSTTPYINIFQKFLLSNLISQQCPKRKKSPTGHFHSNFSINIFVLHYSCLKIYGSVWFVWMQFWDIPFDVCFLLKLSDFCGIVHHDILCILGFQLFSICVYGLWENISLALFLLLCLTLSV